MKNIEKPTQTKLIKELERFIAYNLSDNADCYIDRAEKTHRYSNTIMALLV